MDIFCFVNIICCFCVGFFWLVWRQVPLSFFILTSTAGITSSSSATDNLATCAPSLRCPTVLSTFPLNNFHSFHYLFPRRNIIWWIVFYLPHRFEKSTYLGRGVDDAWSHSFQRFASFRNILNMTKVRCPRWPICL